MTLASTLYSVINSTISKWHSPGSSSPLCNWLICWPQTNTYLYRGQGSLCFSIHVYSSLRVMPTPHDSRYISIYIYKLNITVQYTSFKCFTITPLPMCLNYQRWFSYETGWNKVCAGNNALNMVSLLQIYAQRTAYLGVETLLTTLKDSLRGSLFEHRLPCTTSTTKFIIQSVFYQLEVQAKNQRTKSNYVYL